MSDITASPETWAPIAGYESSYRVSDSGRVHSLRNNIILKHSAAGRGYPVVSLSQGGVIKRKYVHHLVAEAFIGPRPDGMDVCHLNGDIKDPRADNLRYDTRHSNMRDALGHGTHLSTQRTHCSKGHELTEGNVYRRYYKSADGGPKYRDRCKECMKVKSRHDYALWKQRQASI